MTLYTMLLEVILSLVILDIADIAILGVLMLGVIMLVVVMLSVVALNDRALRTHSVRSCNLKHQCKPSLHRRQVQFHSGGSSQTGIFCKPVTEVINFLGVQFKLVCDKLACLSKKNISGQVYLLRVRSNLEVLHLVKPMSD